MFLEKNAWLIILAIGSSVIFFCFFRVIKWVKLIKKKPMATKRNTIKQSNVVVTSRDIRAISGENVILTQLDLARAYIEVGKLRLAKQILDHVIQHGEANQQAIAYQLLSRL